MLYNSTRERLLQLGWGYTALIADALYFLGFTPLQQFTAQEAILIAAPLGINAKIVRVGLNNAIFKVRGRRNQVFTMPDPNEARKATGASVLKIRDNLPASAFKSLKNYRQALHHALIVRRPGQYTRGLLARRLKVCKQTTRNYDRACGHKVTEQHRRTPLLPHDLDAMPTAKIKGGKRKRWLGKLDDQGFVDKFAPMVKAIALQWLKGGHEVVILEQMASDYQPAADLPYNTGSLSEFIHS